MDVLERYLADARAAQRLPSPSVRRAVREAAGLSQEQLADVLSVDQATVSRWEEGRRSPRRRSAAAYAELLERLARESAGPQLRGTPGKEVSSNGAPAP